MVQRIIAIDQSTSSTKALLFDEQCKVVARTNVDHKQYYPQTGWVEHDAEEIYQNLKRGEFNLTDLETAFQPLKPFVYGHIHKHVSDIGPIKHMPSPFQAKNA
jgi:hypothetical protein